jgi:hypothetical protein
LELYREKKNQMDWPHREAQTIREENDSRGKIEGEVPIEDFAKDTRK